MIFNGYRYGFQRVPDYSHMLERTTKNRITSIYNFFDYNVNNIISFSINFELNFNCNAFEQIYYHFSLLSRC